MKYCLIKDGAIHKYNADKPKIVTGEVDGTYLPLEDNVPSYDTATHRINGTSYDLQADKVVKVYDVVEIPQEEIMTAKAKSAEQAVQAHINAKCVELGYDSENSIAKYLVEGNAFYTECKTISLWISDVWVYTYQVQADVVAGLREIPTNEELLAELPVFIEGAKL